MSKKAYFLKKKHEKDKAEINNISYLQMVGWNRMKGKREESTLLCICFLYSFDFKTLLMFYIFKTKLKQFMRKKENWMQTETN